VTTYNLPPQPTPFIGREQELADIGSLLANPDCRLLTLVGPGGIGKTRLALEAVRMIAGDVGTWLAMSEPPFPDGICFVPLQPLTSPDFIVPTIASVLNFTFYGARDPKQQLLDYLREQRLLLLLDNFEHLMDGVNLLPEILDDAPRIRLLVTSRERLNLREEWVYDVRGLSFPENGRLSTLEDYTAVQLFLQNARRAGYAPQDTDAAAIVRICQMVEGIPLAIELAAAWVRIMPCAEIAREVERSLDILTTTTRNVPEKHRSMRAAFERSWDLLTGEEQAEFRKLSVFRGGFTREAAEQIAGATLRTLSALVDKSLLRVDRNGRYDLHELLRQYSAERLAGSSEEAEQIHDRHCSYYARFMERQWSRLTGSEIKSSLHDINIELDNVRAGWEWAVHYHKAAEVEAALYSLGDFYWLSSRYPEGQQIFAGAATAFSGNAAVYGKLLARQGTFCQAMVLISKARALLEESVALLRQVGVRDDLAFALYWLVACLYFDPNFSSTTATQYLEESLEIYTELDNHWGMGEVLNWWCIILYTQGVEQGRDDYLQKAWQCGQESLVAFQQHGSAYGIAGAQVQLGYIAYLQGAYHQAFVFCQKSLEFFQELGIRFRIMFSLFTIGYAACALGAYGEARRLALQSLMVDAEYGMTGSSPYTPTTLQLAAAILVGEGEKERAYELLAVVDQQRIRLGIRKGHGDYFLLRLVDEEVPPYLAAAVERGRARDFDAVVKEVIHDLTRSEESAAPFPLFGTSQPDADLLNERERQILSLVAEGLSNHEIAAKLFLTVNTVKWYLKGIFGKLHVASRTQAVANARALGLLS
jgi:predicted ATPase/DNA-binding NarL/FixJ family response regulator